MMYTDLIYGFILVALVLSVYNLGRKIQEVHLMLAAVTIRLASDAELKQAVERMNHED